MGLLKIGIDENMNKIYYIVKDHFPSGIKYTPLKFTGRWKISFMPYTEEPILFLEHQGMIFKKWVSEDDLRLRTERKDFINRC